jgi:predicted ATPase
MLTRLKVSGFKNLVDVDVRFGPFTCIAGVNGVGKSNLLDAIKFLSYLANEQLVAAAMSVRDERSRVGDIASIFHRHGEVQDDTMSFEAYMVIPKNGKDDLGQDAEATTTFVRYSLRLRLRKDYAATLIGQPIEILSEELVHIKANEYKKELGFKASSGWSKSVLTGRRFAPYYISTIDADDGPKISLHQDQGSGGRTRRLAAKNLPRTVLSSANAAENPTATLVRQEMMSWRLLQLEPSALRSPDTFNSPVQMGSDGSHLPATLYNLAHQPEQSSWPKGELGVYQAAANRLSELLDDVRSIRVDRDDKRDLLTLQVAGKDGTYHSARSLSDGTLRFLALTVLVLNSRSQGVICMEEPENGIHPARIPAILRLLQDIAVDPTEPNSEDNPLRQVIINTHSPAVVAQVPEHTLLVAESVTVMQRGLSPYEKVAFKAIKDTWRAKCGTEVVAFGKLLAYLNPIPKLDRASESELSIEKHGWRVIDNPDIQGNLFGSGA